MYDSVITSRSKMLFFAAVPEICTACYVLFSQLVCDVHDAAENSHYCGATIIPY